MSEALWWRDEFWWDQKSIPMGPVTFSPRQLLTIALAGVVGLLVSAPLNLPIGGIAFGGKAVAFLACVGVGYMISKKRVKMVPVELQLFYTLSARRKGRVQQSKRVSAETVMTDAGGPEKVETNLVVDDFKSVTPLSVAGRVPAAKLRKQSKLLLLVDGMKRDEVAVSQDAPDYRFVFKPGPADIGAHDATIVVEGNREPIAKLKIVIRKEGTEMLESKK